MLSVPAFEYLEVQGSFVSPSILVSRARLTRETTSIQGHQLADHVQAQDNFATMEDAMEVEGCNESRRMQWKWNSAIEVTRTM